ncbi:hypothetical protein COLO4_16750 [Corchorus olitorius]|uniref:non-specific serine/threonine protein kinase n=1 Tax=Corchorus olitorius TaxID=93759 RepID=A0A1R3JFT7_9ROSI|nr:hypothetical protein COLO4_16750 [Corchorus olitorius]
MMWFFGFTTRRRHLLVMGAIVLVIFVTMMLKKLAIYLEAQAINGTKCRDDLHKESADGNNYMNHHHNIDIHHQYHHQVSRKSCSFCCSNINGALIRTYALQELKMATANFRIRIGVGATSFVYLAELGDGKFGAVKRVMEERGGTKKIFLDEVSVLLRISHPNLVGLLGFCLEKGEQLLLLEYVANKSLFERMHTYHGQSSGILTWSNRLSIALDIARALHYLHSQADPPIIHRDVKSSNILLIDNNHAKLADFGLCKLGYDKPNIASPTPIKGSLGYVDTNYLKTGLVSTKSDVYSFGVLLLELITGLKSTQGSATLAEWTAECRKNDDVEVLAKLLDPKLKGDANLEQLKVLIDLANASLLENSQGRPDMSHIVDRILTCMEPHPHPPLPV